MQSRMARAGLKWSLTLAAERANIGRASVSRIEADLHAHTSTVILLRRAYEAAGVEFLDNDGVRIRTAKDDSTASSGAQ